MSAPEVRTITRSHWIRSNETSRMPTAYLFVQVAQRTAQLRAGVVHSWRSAVTSYVTKSHHGNVWREPVTRGWDDPLTMWTHLSVLCREGSRLVVVSHDLGVTLRVARGFHYLPLLGWEVKLARLDRGAALVVWRKGRRTLVMVDALAWLSGTVDELGAVLGVQRLPLPKAESDDEGHHARAARDLWIVRESFLRVMEWVTSSDLGNWRPTASGQVFQAWRHRFMTHGILAHDDVDAREAERRAAWAGRCEAWRHGTLRGGPWVEWDYRAAYATIAALEAVPVALEGSTARMTWHRWRTSLDTHALLADVRVTTETPVVPAQGPHGIVWPVGTFSTTLWDCEVEALCEAGAGVELGRVWLYRKAPALAAVAEWILDLMDGPGRGGDPLVAMLAKGWSRSIVGRFAARWPRWQPWGDAPHEDVRSVRIIDLASGDRSDALHLGRRMVIEGALQDAPDSAPQVTSWITARARVKLWTLMRAVGLEHVVYVDTDSLIVDPVGHLAMERLAPEGVRIKGTYRDLTVLGPRQLVVNYRPRISGVPRDADSEDGKTWRSQAWRTVRTSLREGSADSVVVRERVQRIAGVDHRRVHREDGTTASVRLGSG